MLTGENSVIEAHILYHSNSNTCIVLLFAVKYKLMTLWLNTTINSPFNQARFKSLMNFSAFSQWGVGLCFASRA